MNKVLRLFILFGLMAHIHLAFGQVNADFNSNVQSGCSPLQVIFTNLSSGPITSYLWNFGNGNTSTLQSPGVFYTVPGTYTVSLTVSDGTVSDTRTRVNFITVFAEPSGGLTASVTSGCAPLIVGFTDQTVAGSAPIVTWIWDFGDGVTSNNQNPTHIYNNAGSYDITLVAIDSNGCSTTYIEPDYITVSTSPRVDFSADFPQACTAPHTVAFTSIVTPAAPNYTYLWDFGDGNTSSAANPGHVYNITGNYTVSLTVTDPLGCAATETKIQFVQIGSPVANFTVGSPRTCVGRPVTFTNTSTGANSYSWDFGDGGTSTATSPIHAYSAPGIYSVQLTVVNTNFGCSDTYVFTNAVDVRPTPAVNFSATNTVGCRVPHTVNFTDNTAGAVTWSWNFGDGNTANNQNPNHVYTSIGIYDVTLTVTNSDGCSATRTIPSLVQIVPPSVDFVASQTQGCVPVTINFLDLSNSNDPIVTWVWNFGDGTSSFVQNPTHTYTIPGQYTVRLDITTQSGCQGTLTRINYIEVGNKPTADFLASPNVVCVEDTVCFTNLTNFGSQWFWDFGDGGTSNAQSPCYVYQDTGTFTVMLIAEHFGCRDTMVKQDYIRSVGPIANFALVPARGCTTPFSVSFFDQSVDPTTWHWDFGDGDTSNLQNPTHTYTSVGTFTVTLVVSNTNTNCTDVATAVVDIASPSASFTVPPTYGCPGTAVSFTNTSLNATAYEWDFGDGGTSTAFSPSYTFNTPGSYNVQLIAQDGFGCADTFITSTLVTIAGSVPEFGVDTTFGCSPLTVIFSDSTTVFPSPGNAIAGWFWDFGDGNSSNSQNPIHTYNTPGSYTVILQIVDTEGCVAQTSKSGFINPTFPNAGFSTQDTVACPGSLVRFTNTSTGTGLSYLWDFGDGTISTTTNPQHLYPPGGPYTITLTVTDINGCSDNEIRTNYVMVTQPTANFSSSATTAACPPLQVNFLDQSSPDVNTWYWDFGDGSTSSLANPQKVYGTAGTYTVTLIVTTAQGCRDTLEILDLVQLSGPTGSFTMNPITGCNPLTVNFAATTNGAVSWSWDFGDGSLGTGQTTSHTYTRDTTARPTLIMRDTAGCPVIVQASDSLVVKALPIPDFTVDFDDICLGQRVTFTNTTVSRDQVTLYSWNFGDGTTSGLQNPTHTYTAVGVYTVTLAAETNEGCRDTISTPITINVKGPPTAVFTPSKTRGCEPFTNVIFTDNSFGPFVINSWNWDFADGNTSTQQNPVHTFASSGIFNVRLIVTDIEGCSDTTFRTITVDALPNVDFTVSNRFGCGPHSVLFQDQTSGAAAATSWFWDFGDGNTSTQQNPLHVYANDGIYTVSLNVTDNAGCTSSLTKFNYIVLRHPTADFTSNATITCPPQTVNFTDISAADTTISNWYWDFGDGGTSTQQNPTHVYYASGTFSVRLIIENIFGCRDTVTRSNIVTTYVRPTASFSIDQTSFCTPDSIRVSSTSTGGTAPIVGYVWDFGNGNLLSGPSVSYTYFVPGVYQMNLIVTDANGCRDTAYQTINANPLPVADFVVSDSMGCSIANLTFYDRTSSINTLNSWSWSFGDGLMGSGASPTHTYLNDGTYTVRLIVTDINGCRDTVVKPNYIQLDHPDADFAISDTIACPMTPIGFSDMTTGHVPAIAWGWNFGDGTISTAQNPIHQYASPGIYTVTLTVTDSLGCMDTEVRPAIVRILPTPNAAFTVNDPSGCTPHSLVFTDGSSPAVAPIISHFWKFGDGNTSGVPSPSHTYTQHGLYNPVLIVTDQNGCQDSATTSIDAFELPVANFTSVDSIGCNAQVVRFTDLTSSPYLITNWNWNFGDGNTSTLSSPVHTYTGLGPYNVTLSVTDANGCVDMIAKTNFVRLLDPKADFTYDKTLGCPGMVVNFTDSSTTDTTIQTWNWDFGDGITSNLQNPGHVYANPGVYTVSLTITTVVGCVASKTYANLIRVQTPPNSAFTFSPNTGCPPLPVQFTDGSSASSSAITQWAWDFGTGNTSSAQNPLYTFPNGGNFPVKLVITDNGGCKDSVTQTVSVVLPPVAGFFTNDTLGCAPHFAQFFDLTSGSSTIVNWQWDFGDGTTGSSQNPSHTYTADGSYTVSLIVTDGNGCMDTISKVNYINLSNPDADFANTLAMGCPGMTITFEDQSIPDYPIASWAWNFGDGNTSNVQNPVHSYTTPGTYTVTLTVTNVNGCSDTEVKTNLVTIYSPPGAGLVALPSSGCTPLFVQFNDASAGVSAALTNWNWDFGDGNSSVLQNPQNTFTAPGIYNVTLEVTDANGCRDTIVRNVRALDLVQADFATNDTIGCGPKTVAFTDLSSSPNGLSSWNWDFGDGNTSTLQHPSHTYTTDGLYTVRLAVTDVNGCADTLEKINYIRLTRPVVDFTLDRNLGCPGTVVNFTDLTVPDTTVTAWAWDFGDGGTSTLQNPSHGYITPGTYTVSLQVTNILGCTASHIKVDTIVILDRPDAAFTQSDTLACTPASIMFFNTSVPSAAPITGYLWDFGNGNTSALANPSQIYSTPGTYQVSLMVTDGNGCIDTVSRNIRSLELPEASFSATDSFGCASATINFSDQSLSPYPLTNWFWDFGDGNTATTQFPSNTYTSDGSYTVSLRVVDQNGCSDSISKTNYINLDHPVADFTVSNTTTCPGVAISFTDISTPDTTLSTWLWDFGDGNTSSLQNPNHVYLTSGTYTVSLTITNIFGCSDTRTRTNLINVLQGPVADFLTVPPSGCPALLVQFTDASTGVPSPIVSRAWDFGNGNTSTALNPTQTYPVPGMYTIRLVATDNQGCRDTVTRQVEVFTPPVANFVASDSVGCAPSTITFSDLTTGSAPIVFWDWDFGDGGTSTAPSPTYAYSSDGVYTVTLIVADANGCADTLVRTNYIRLSHPVAQFTLAPDVGCPGTLVSFTDLSFADTTLATWQWNFGDGNTSLVQNPVHMYNTTGTYTVSLTVTNVLGCSDAITKVDTILIQTPPSAAFVPAFNTGCAPFSTPFTDNSVGTSSPVVQWNWDFGNGATSTVQNPVGVFPNPGNYLVTLIVTDNNGCPDTATRNIQVNTPPTAGFFTNDTLGCALHTTNFFDTSTGSAAITGWLWDFGDGNISIQQHPVHIYATDGFYNVTLITTDANGCRDTLVRPNYIRLSNPFADFAISQVNGCPELEVKFTDKSIPDNPLVSWLWDFGDGSTSTIQNPRHTYINPGLYTVSLTVTNIVGCSDTRTMLDTIEVFTPPNSSFTMSPNAGCNPVLIQFTQTATGNSAPVTNWSWDFGNGNTSLFPNPDQLYTTPGIYPVTLIATDGNGCKDTVTNNAESFDLPSVQFQVSDSNSCAPLTLNFTDLSSGPVPAVAWFWDFGDGNTSTLQHPTNFYGVNGTYTVTLIVTDANGCVDTLEKTNYVRLSRPQADFTNSSAVVCPGTAVSFTNLSIPDTTIVSYFWDFGDGGTDTAQHPTHLYVTPGTYTVSMTLTNIFGCSDTKTILNTIGIHDPPHGNFSMSDTAGCPPMTVYFTNTTTQGDAAISRYEWDFGNGNTSVFLHGAPQTYTTPGFYTVRLVAFDAFGCSDTVEKIVEIFNPPTVDFAASDTVGCAITTINFSDLSTGPAPMAAWQWNFGDGNTGNTRFPSNTYLNDGFYDITLAVTDTNGCSDTLTRQAYIRLSHPQADFSTANLVGCPGTSIQFQDASIPDTTLVNWLWDFGDGNMGTGQNPTHIYASSGQYTVTLTVFNVLGCADTIQKINVVNVLTQPVAAFTPSATAGCSPFAVAFTDSSYGTSSPIVGWSWNFGNGQTSTAQNPSTVYTTPGVYPVTLVVTDLNGCQGTLVRSVESWELPDANFFSLDTLGCAPSTVRFTDLSTGPYPIMGWNWDFGDGNSSTQQNPSHFYSSEGTYTITLVVTDVNGCQDTLVRFEYIDLDNPDANFTVDDATGCTGHQVNFTDQTVTDTTLVSWQWNFGDGSTASVQNPSHVYTSPGLYSVSLTVVDILGCTNTEIKVDTIEIFVSPTARFQPSDTLGCTPFAVVFSDSSTNGSSPIIAWQWDLGNGLTDTLQNATTVYPVAGTYPITLTVTDLNGCSDVVTRTIEAMDSPVADFVASDTVGCAPMSTNFTDLSTTSNTLVSWSWNFGDGNTSTAQNPTHTYSQDGLYTVSLIVTDMAGCPDTMVKTQYIRLSHPVADFVPSTTQGCEYVAIGFTDTSVPDTTLIGWQWDFGDGGTSAVQNPVYTYTNSGVYTVSLIVTNVLGCRDTVIYPNLIDIHVPPVAGFTTTTTSGCSPLTSSFADVSTSVNGIGGVRWYIDGVFQTSNRSLSHTFVSAGNYTVMLVAEDIYGCADTTYQGITVYMSPIANFIVSDSLGCGPATVQFTDRTATGNIATWEWDFGDGTTSTLQNPTHTYAQNGTYDVKLIVADAGGCSDSLLKPAYIKLGHPVVDFEVEYTPGCPPVDVTVTGNSVSGFPITQWDWSYGNGNSGSGNPATYTYTQSGMYTLTLVATDSVGCRDTVVKSNAVEVFEDIQPPMAPIHFVSVESDQQVRVSFKAYSGSDFGGYNVYRQEPAGLGPYVLVHSAQFQTDTIFTDRGAGTPGGILDTRNNSYCYKVAVVNNCGTIADLSTEGPDCTVELSATPLPGEILVDWQAYRGWNAVQAYEVHRVTSYNPLVTEFLDLVPGSQTAYKDSTIKCFDNYSYRVKAIGFDVLQEAWSDTATAINWQVLPSQANEMVRATVEDDKTVLLEWKPFETGIATIVIEKQIDEPGALWQTIGNIPGTDLKFIDRDVNVQEFSYSYRVSARDSCNNLSPQSNLGKSILLEIDQYQGVSKLSWSAYEAWRFGVDIYEIEVFDEGVNAWTLVDIVQGTITSYDDRVTSLEQAEYCYRITAHELGGNQTLSRSNRVCVPIFPQVYAPNAITPNFDNINDEFLIKGVFVENYNLMIFDRWGLKVFETTDINEGWNGTYKGQPVPEGVYVFVAKGVGFNGSPFQLDGSITVIR